ncbi:lactoylglutathione lyase [Mangrovimicrobium sediminis]|uniref:Lactoylglutathione lyase n=1 Tax=Mangrovimicrobium sediminis TaxID=2562682 RepID=A0A4Z0LVA7_9GAMM|nr:VOC family protein [Haliea sp. SAOS-164]TGD71333.1 lactoylglutathione lyase [Haliea sp. SAOS-164]
MIRGVHHFAVHVNDMDKMVKFYKDAFGFELVGEGFSWENDDFIDKIVDVPNSAARGCMLRAGTCYMEMFQYSAPAPKSSRPLDPQDKGYTHFCVDVIGIEEEFKRLQGLGMTFSQPEPINVGHVKSIYGRDPEGNVIELQETVNCDFPLENLESVTA